MSKKDENSLLADTTRDSKEPLQDVDSIIQSIGEYGKYQKLLTGMFCLIMIPPVYQTLIMAFVGYNPAWKCSLQGNKTGQCTELDQIYSSGDKAYTSRCSMDRKSWDFIKPKEFSVVTEFDLVCDYKELAIVANSGVYIGWAIGAIVLGWVSDKYGRKMVLYPSAFCVLLISFIASFSPNIWMVMVCRVFIGFFLGGTVLTLFIVCAELVGPRYRAFASTLVWFAFTLSLCILGLQAYLIPNWRLLMKITSAPYLILLGFWWFTPESVRWLHVQNRTKEADEILRKVAKTNKTVYPVVDLQPISSQQSKVSLLHLFKTRKMALMTVVMCFVWFVNGMVYYGISLASDDLGGDMYRDFVLTSLVEIPGNILVIYLSDRFGRKKAVTVPMFITAISLIVIALIPGRTNNPAMDWSRVALGMLGKLFITTAFDGLYILSAESYPTVVRSQAMALLSVVSRVGAATAPWVAQGLRVLHATIPFYFMGALSLIAAFLCLTFTETRGKPTAETFEAAEEMLPETELTNDIEKKRSSDEDIMIA